MLVRLRSNLRTRATGARGRFHGYSDAATDDFLFRFPYVQEMPDAPA